MADLANTCEGTSGSAIATGNGAPNGWDLVTLTGIGTTFTTDNAHAHSGLTSAKLHYPAAIAASIHADWKAAISPTSVANAYASVYVYLTAYPTVNLRVGYFLSANVLCASFTIALTTGTIKTFNSANTNLATSVAAVPLNQWVRIDFEITGISGTTGTVAMRMYSGANLETLTANTNGSISTAGAAVTGLVDEFRLANATPTTHTANFDAWYDDPRFSSVATPGPYRPLRPPLRISPTAAMRAAHW